MPRVKLFSDNSPFLFDSIPDIEDDQGTAADSVAHAVVPSATKTAAILLTEDVSKIRTEVKTLSYDAGQTHQLAYQHEWSVLTQQRGTQSPVDLLDQLGVMGFAWRDIAQLIGVSVPAVQKWRKGERLSGDNRRKLASLIAAIDLLVGHFYVEDIASWFEVPVSESAPITPIDLWAKGERVLFFDYGMGHLTSEETLNRFDPEWRERYRTDFVTFRSEDGHLGLRVQER